MAETAEIGVFGGSGFYALLPEVREIKVDTPYGSPSDSIFLAEVAGRRVAFLPRHGRRHTIPPHKINYRANVWAMRSLGVKAVISPCAAGSLQRDVKPGDFVVCDQFVDRTNGRADTFFDGPIVTHLSSADTYDPVLRELTIQTIRDHGIPVHECGTVVVIQGPRFSTKSESRWFMDAGWITDPSRLIDILGLLSLHQCLLVTWLSYWFFQRHRPRYESKLNATYYKVR